MYLKGGTYTVVNQEKDQDTILKVLSGTESATESLLLCCSRHRSRTGSSSTRLYCCCWSTSLLYYAVAAPLLASPSRCCRFALREKPSSCDSSIDGEDRSLSLSDLYVYLCFLLSRSRFMIGKKKR